MISMDITDDEDPAIGDKIREIHRNRFENDPAFVGLVENLGSYEAAEHPKSLEIYPAQMDLLDNYNIRVTTTTIALGTQGDIVLFPL
jgi:hypothetical protein